MQRDHTGAKGRGKGGERDGFISIFRLCDMVENFRQCDICFFGDVTSMAKTDFFGDVTANPLPQVIKELNS